MRGRRAGRLFHVGELVAGGDGAKGGWRLPDLVGHLYAAYCGPLAVEAAHLTSRR